MCAWAVGGLLAVELACGAATSAGWLAVRAEDARITPWGLQPTVEESLIQWQVAGVEAIEDDLDVWAVGDSACVMGVRPRVLEAAGVRAWNLGTIGWLGVGGHTDLLERALSVVGGPGQVVYVVAPATLALGGEDVERLGWRDRLGRWRAVVEDPGGWTFPPSRRLGWWVSGWARRVLPGVSAADGLPRGPFPSDEAVRATLRAERGWCPEPRRVRWSGRETLRTPVSEAARAGLRRLAKLAPGVVVCVIPLPEVYDTVETRAELARLEEVLREEVERVWVPGFYPSGLCSLGGHLTPEGAQRFSEELAARLGR